MTTTHGPAEGTEEGADEGLGKISRLARRLLSWFEPDNTKTTLRIMGGVLVGFFFLPAGIGYGGAFTMRWQGLAAAPQAWIGMLYPSVFGAALLVATIGTWPATQVRLLLLLGSLPELVRIGRWIAHDSSVLSLVASLHELVWLGGLAACLVALSAPQAWASHRKAMRWHLAGAFVLAVYFFIPTRNWGYWPRSGLGAVAWLVDGASDMGPYLSVISHGCMMTLAAILLVEATGRRTPPWAWAIVLFGGIVQGVAQPIATVAREPGMSGVLLTTTGGLTSLALKVCAVVGMSQTIRMRSGVAYPDLTIPVLPPALPSATVQPMAPGLSIEQRLARAKSLHEAGLLSSAELQAIKRDVLSSL